MDVLCKTKLQSCLHYESETKPTVEIRNLEQNHQEDITLQKNEIVFIVEGEVRFVFRNYAEKTLHKGEFIFISVGGIFRFTVLEKTRAIIFRLNGNVKLCSGFRIEELYSQGNTRRKGEHRELYPLEINQLLWYYLNGLSEAIQGGLSCRYYFDTKVNELLVLLKVYYPHETLKDFFASILSPDTMFSEYVRANHHKYKTSKELAMAMNMTPKLFSKKFMQVFGEPALAWMSREKALCVYSDLHSGDEPIALIADKYWFSSQAHLTKFCKRELGKNPGEIRKWMKEQKTNGRTKEATNSTF